jgi:hypothetical protein
MICVLTCTHGFDAFSILRTRIFVLALLGQSSTSLTTMLTAMSFSYWSTFVIGMALYPLCTLVDNSIHHVLFTVFQESLGYLQYLEMLLTLFLPASRFELPTRHSQPRGDSTLCCCLLCGRDTRFFLSSLFRCRVLASSTTPQRHPFLFTASTPIYIPAPAPFSFLSPQVFAINTIPLTHPYTQLSSSNTNINF